jgi:fructuronate reductase
MTALTQAGLASLKNSALGPVRIPSYARGDLAPGVVHLGLGAFHRAHQAMVFDSLLQRGDARWGVLGVAMRSTQVADTLAAQNGLYSVQVVSASEHYWQVVGSVLQTCVAAREPQQVVAAIAAASTRWLTLTVTEKGYTPELAALIVQGLAVRHAAGHAGLTIASCDNLSGNGDLLQALCLQAADDAALKRWIKGACAFPNSMVDRIVPAATAQRQDQAAEALQLTDAAALGTEGFWEWVLQDRLADPADADLLRAAGVTVVPEVTPFEEAKLRLLNGSHSAMACMGAVLGLPTIGDCIGQPAIRQFVRELMTQEVMPHLSRPGLAAYRDALLARFGNPALRACLRSKGGRASGLSGWAARRKFQAKACALAEFATPQTARESTCPSGWDEIGRFACQIPCMGLSPCCEMLASNSSRLRPNAAPFRSQTGS